MKITITIEKDNGTTHVVTYECLGEAVGDSVFEAAISGLPPIDWGKMHAVSMSHKLGVAQTDECRDTKVPAKLHHFQVNETPGWENIRVYLDGCKVEDVYGASAYLGWVDVLKGKTLNRLYGKVEIILED